jgi:hypothetical protein
MNMGFHRQQHPERANAPVDSTEDASGGSTGSGKDSLVICLAVLATNTSARAWKIKSTAYHGGSVIWRGAMNND